MNHTQRLAALRDACLQATLDGWLQPTTDRFMSEYPPDATQRLRWLSGFSGSAGCALVLRDKALLFTDGRYTLQAAQQCPDYEVIDTAEMSPAQWLRMHAPDAQIGFDPWIHSEAQARSFADTGLVAHANLIDELWEDQPPLPKEPVMAHPLELAGQQVEEKIADIVAQLKEKDADAVILTLPDGVNWLLNIRGQDVAYNPLMLGYAVVSAQGDVVVITQPRDVIPAQAGIQPLDVLDTGLEECDVLHNAKRILIDPAVSSHAWFTLLSDKDIIEAPDPTLLPKAIKNATEQEGMREAHRRDGRALSAFLTWLDEALTQGEVSELQVMQKLEAFRQEQEDYRGPSFATIAGSGANGAIIHYHADETSNRVIGDGELLLLDSGGQYGCGTTDVTRTIVNGTPTPEMVANFTRVLKGHIAIARARFPKGTTGAQLDVLARQPLWDAGLDYAHGTGHGVGSYLCVHEGPQRISKRGGDVALQPGMILSNEPGYYKNGAYGIRIENLVMVVEGDDGFLAFETLTLAPMDRRLVDETMLSESEREWLADYHKRVAANSG